MAVSVATEFLRLSRGQALKAEARAALAKADALRDRFTQKIDAIRSDMRSQVSASVSIVIHNQQQAIFISAIVTALAATVGLGVALFVASGIARPAAEGMLSTPRWAMAEALDLLDSAVCRKYTGCFIF